MVKKPVKHHDNNSGPGDQQIAKDLVDVLFDIDKIVDCPRFMVTSRELCQVPLVPSAGNSEVVPLGSRMEELENTVGKLVKCFKEFKTSAVAPAPASFASVAAPSRPVHGGQNGVGVGGSFGGARPKDNPFSGRSVQNKVGGGTMQAARFYREMLMSLSEKRKVDEDDQTDQAENANANGGEYQYPHKRRARKVNYGKCSVEIAGGEAAPYEVFVGNTNPASTPEIIGDVLKKCAELLPPD